jgi:hypothetical protein
LQRIIYTDTETIGYELTKDILMNGLALKTQDDTSAKSFTRLSPEMSEITIEELTLQSPLYPSNKIRMLQDPHTNAFLKTSDEKISFQTRWCRSLFQCLDVITVVFRPNCFRNIGYVH